MAGEADFAFRQALALCPYNPEAMKSHAEFLKKQNRNSDAALVSEMEKQFPKQKWSEMRWDGKSISETR